MLGVSFHETTTVSRICWRYFTLHLYYCFDSFLPQEYSVPHSLRRMELILIHNHTSYSNC